MPNIGPLELGIVLVVVLVIFGPKRLPELGRSLGGGIRGFRQSVSDRESADNEKAVLVPATANDSESLSTTGDPK